MLAQSLAEVMIKIKTHSVFICSQVLDGLKMIFIPKSNANLVMNITYVLLYLSRALYIFEGIDLCVQDLFLSELLQAMISLARD
jgi:hypothetical protein